MRLNFIVQASGIETKAKYYDIANSAKEVFELAEKGNIQATKIVNEAKETLMNMFAINAGIIAPHNFFIGGSVALAQKQFVIDAFNLAKKLAIQIILKTLIYILMN
ncbi:ROK family protein [Mycoplasmopsis cynos]|uniref:ROK family protein n=1 Tax=Mycoplasmopsis cynos TaxID=171284 RepID=UPI0024CACDC3|nr:ROK family protein [Mycoplasmopsis cynos]WAM03105.1 ROK family protein [Mycoplasmopsis cynos]